MNKAEYLNYQKAVERGLEGLDFVSTGACTGCAECGLVQQFKIVGVPVGVDLMETVFDSHEDAEKEIEAARKDPELAGVELLHLRVEEIEPDQHQIELASEPHFSWSACECCGSDLGGNRHPAHGCDKNGDIVHFSVCEDCLYYINYEQLDDVSMEAIEAS